MTNQEIFDKVHTHLLTQRTAAIENGSCAYRAGTQTCAVGALIPDALYTTEIEGASVATLISQGASVATLISQGDTCPHHQLATTLKQAGFTPDQYPLLRDLQRVHDRLLPRATDKPHPDPMARALCGLRVVAAQHELACAEYALTELQSVLDYLEYTQCPPQLK
jgi:hypothetical protein